MNDKKWISISEVALFLRCAVSTSFIIEALKQTYYNNKAQPYRYGNAMGTRGGISSEIYGSNYDAYMALNHKSDSFYLAESGLRKKSIAEMSSDDISIFKKYLAKVKTASWIFKNLRDDMGVIYGQ